jgi:ribosome-binding protein aMBF1 (putative translation factor)
MKKSDAKRCAIVEDVAKRIKEGRIKSGISRKEASERLNIPIRTLASYERAEREIRIDKVLEMVNVYGMTAVELTGTPRRNR